ncbi:MAG: S24 family peptidase [Candidatus Saccharibacteria bacterium]|nr:S24 family peptidase [Candidatus Saccharibacteria bacterium]
MNEIQSKVLELAETKDVGAITYYRLSKILGVDHPYKVKYAIDRLVEKQLLTKRPDGSIEKVVSSPSEGFVKLPYYGEVNCGEATALAEDRIQSYLEVSPSVLGISDLSNLFALKASGDSMNSASIKGNPVNDGDYVIARKKSNYLPSNGDYVISIIGGAANLKKFRKDVKNRQIVLESESTEDLPPIVISEEDIDSLGLYSVAAQAVAVVKMS